MSDQIQDTVLNSITDNVADSFFEGGASSKNIITPEEKTAVPEKKPEEAIKNMGFLPETKLSAADLIGDLLEKPAQAVTDHVAKTTVEPEKVEKKEDDYSFLIEKGLLAGFEDDSPIKTKEDLETLIKGNKEQWISEARAEAVKQEVERLPEAVKFVLEYAKSGGQDLRSIFKILSQDEESRSYDTSQVQDQKDLIRKYYSTQGWNDDEIEEELINLVETKRIEAKAIQFKPKLEQINTTRKDEALKQQKLIEEDQLKARKFFTQNVVDTLKKGKIGDINLTKEEQADVYNALVREQYQSFSGQTNRLGALLDRIQYVEPNYELLAEVTLLLSNPAEYKKKIRDEVKTEVTADTVKKIKIEQNKQKINSEHNPEKENKKMPKLSSNFINPFA